MPNETRDQEREIGDQVRAPVIMLWLLAFLIAEVEFWMLAFAHMYRM